MLLVDRVRQLQRRERVALEVVEAVDGVHQVVVFFVIADLAVFAQVADELPLYAVSCPRAAPQRGDVREELGFALLPVPICLVPSVTAFAQNSGYPTGKPSYMLSKRSRTFAGVQTNGRWISGSPISPNSMFWMSSDSE